MRCERILETAYESLNKMIKDRGYRMEDEHVYKNFYRFLGSYTDIVPHLPLDEIITFFPGAVDSFCTHEDLISDLDSWIIEYFNAVFFASSGQEVIEVLAAHKEPFFSKLVRLLTLDDRHIIQKTLCVITNLTGMDSNWFVEAFEDRNIIEVISRLFQRNDIVFFTDIFIILTNFFIGSQKFALRMKTDHHFIFSILQLSENKPELDEQVLSFFRIFFDEPTSKHLQEFALANPEIIDFFIAKIKPDQSIMALGKICRILRELIQIADQVACRFPDAENFLIERIKDSNDLMQKINEAENTNDTKVKQTYQNLLIDFFDDVLIYPD